MLQRRYRRYNIRVASLGDNNPGSLAAFGLDQISHHGVDEHRHRLTPGRKLSELPPPFWVLACLARSAPVECVFRQCGCIASAARERQGVSGNVLEQVMFLQVQLENSVGERILAHVVT